MSQDNSGSLDLQGWLRRLEALHPATIELGLERVRRVFAALNPVFDGTRLVIVGGTNGKGSTVAMLAEVLRECGHRVGTYTSPHLLRYNERVCLDGREATDAELCAAFAAVEAVRGTVSLTYFEFGTLAALHYFAGQRPDFLLLEVGLGGRLDAVNIVDAELGILTNVALDHMDWLGSDREQIGFEKAGIFRPGRPAIYGESAMPASVAAEAVRRGAKLLRLGREYTWHADGAHWCWQGRAAQGGPLRIDGLPALQYPLDNAAAVVQALQCLAVPMTVAQLAAGLARASVPGRFQELRYRGCRVIVDVAHNPHAAANLARNIRTRLGGRPVQLVLAMLADKDSVGVLAELAPVVAGIHAAGLGGERGSDGKIIYNYALQTGVPAASCHKEVPQALDAACTAAGSGGVVVVTGSFFTVAAVLELL